MNYVFFCGEVREPFYFLKVFVCWLNFKVGFVGIGSNSLVSRPFKHLKFNH